MSDTSFFQKFRTRFQIEPLTRELSARLWRNYMRQHLGYIGFAVIWMVIVAGCAAGMAKLVEFALDRAFIDRDEFWIWASAWGFFGLAVLRGIGSFLQSVTMQKVGLRIIEKMQNEMLGSFLAMEIQYFEREGTAKQLSRFTSDCYFLRDAVTKVFTGAGRDLLVLVAMIGLMIEQNWQLALFALVFFPLAVLPIARIGRRLRKVSEATQTELGQMTSVLDDSLKNARQVRAYSMQDHEAARGRNAFETTFTLTAKSVRTRAYSYPIMESLAGITLFFIILLGGFQILEGQQTVGSFMSFFFAVFMAYNPMRSLAGLNASLQHGLGAAKRIFGIIDYVPVIRDADGAVPLKPGKGTVTLQDVYFRYDEDNPVLNGVDIDIAPGETVALVGPSGAGKTTVLNLIPRFYDVDGGSVRIDDQDVTKVTMASVMDQIALVSQEPALFNDTIGANIGFGKPGATRDEIEEAARNAAAHDFIQGLPEGYDTVVGEQGVRLSGGQRQRIAIARAMLKNAPILLLDEATSALDAESERKVQAALQKLMVGRTTVVIAHRLSTIRKADRIFVMDKGKVVEIGAHDDLVKKGGLYSRLCRIQFQDNSEEGHLPPSSPAPVAGD